MKNYSVFLALILFCVSGCAITGYYGSSDINVSDKERTARVKAESFVGKSKSDVLSYYGEPRGIRYNAGFHDGHLGNPNSYTTYDEIWYYKYEAGVPVLWPNQYAIQFYFIGNAVRLVTG